MSQPAADTRVEALIVLTDRLTSAIALQCKSFEAHRPQDTAGSMDEVGKLANLYRRESTEVRSHPELIAGATPDSRRRLVQATEAFDAVLWKSVV